MRLLDNWFYHIENLRMTNVLVIALDEELCKELSRRGIVCHLVRWDGRLLTLWRLRVIVIRQLVDQGISVLHTDIDAVWVKNPYCEIKFKNYDLLASQATNWPQEAIDQWGFVLCCGFFFVSASRGGRDLLALWERCVMKDTDDQRALNRLLCKLGVDWEESEYTTFSFNSGNFRCYPKILRGKTQIINIGLLPRIWPRKWLANKGKTQIINIGLLPHWQFQRVVDSSKEPIVVHPISDQNALSGEKILKQHGYWLLDD